MNTAASAPLRRQVYLLLITLAVAAVCGHILSVSRLYEPYLSRDESNPNDTRGLWPRSRPEPMPSHGDNDRSRWDTVRALVDNGTFVIGHRDRHVALASAALPLAAEGPFQTAALFTAGYQARIKSDVGIITEDGWRTIDKVKRPDTDDFYSSKPPLLPTLAAGEYWLLKHLCGWSITSDRWQVMRTILLTINALPFLIYLLLLGGLLERVGTTDWGRFYVMAAACGGTFLTTFATTFNNHSVATCTALFALYPALRIWQDNEKKNGLFVAAGFFASFTACNELPAAAFAAILFLVLLVRCPVRTLLGYVPAAAVPVAAFLFTNYLAIGEWVPAYDKFGTPWYEYEGSYWKIDPGQIKHGIDWAYQVEGTGMYIFHVLVGHHGLFSLTPVFLLTVAGIGIAFAERGQPAKTDGRAPSSVPRATWRLLAGLTLILAIVVIGFYVLWVPERNHNYGGWTSGLRWLMWLTPFFLLSMVPAADWLAQRRWGRGLAYVLLGLSVFSASYPEWNPWRHPWIYNLLDGQGWVPY
jgi:hypothetical protein